MKGRLQSAIMSNESLEVVNKFCYLCDWISAAGGVEKAQSNVKSTSASLFSGYIFINLDDSPNPNLSTLTMVLTLTLTPSPNPSPQPLP